MGDMATKEKDYQAALSKVYYKENPTDARIYFLYADALAFLSLLKPNICLKRTAAVATINILKDFSCQHW